MSDTGYMLAAIAGLAAVTLITRGFFLIPERDLPLPVWLREALRYAPLAALAAVVVPDIVLTQGQLVPSWKDARLFAAAAATGIYFWRRSILATIVGGSAVMVALRLALGW